MAIFSSNRKLEESELARLKAIEIAKTELKKQDEVFLYKVDFKLSEFREI